MRSSRRARALTLVVTAALIAACGTEPPGIGVPGGSGAPDTLLADAAGLHLVTLHWSLVPSATGYRIERRIGNTGEFTPIADVYPPSVTTYPDTSVEAETFYGYRVRGLSMHGDPGGASVVAGVLTPPVPGISVSVQVGTPGIVDADGYMLTITGGAPDTTIRTPLLTTDARRFSPLNPGSYEVAMSGLAANCSVVGGPTRTLEVTDQGTQTLTSVPMDVACRDPSVGRLEVQVASTGDSLDLNGYVLTLTGVASDTSLPDNERAYFRRDTIGVQANLTYESLRPGDYTLKLTGVAGNCTVAGSATLNFPVAKLADLSRSFSIACQAAVDPTKPVVVVNHWSPASAGPGQGTALDVGLDMSAAPTQAVAGIQARLNYDATVVRLDSARVQGPWQATFNSSTSGLVIWVAFVTGSGVTGNTTFARFYFTAIGASGTTTTTQTTITALADGGGSSISSLARKQEATFTVGTGGGGGNQSPVARSGGPYSGLAGTPVSFNGSTSSDPDGTIASYAWTFGDGGSASGATPTHTYAAAGSYTVTLAVTDNQGTTNQASTTATITGGSGGNQSPVARPGGPYSGLMGTPMQFDGSASSDPDGSIASYAWKFGDGGGGTGTAPTHSYATAGSYTVTLTVTDNLGATNQATTSATVSGGTGHPFTWANAFGPVNPADSMVTLTITLDLSADIVETAGPEALQSWVVDSLKWNPAILRYSSFNFGAGGGSVNPTDAMIRGVLTFNGTQSPGANSGLVPIATIRFKVIGASGTSTQTTTALGPILGTPATGFFSYGSRTAVVESGVQAP